MNNKEKMLASYFLRLAQDEFSNHGCNDVDEEVWKDWSDGERQKFVEEYDPNFLHLSNTSLMGFLAHKLTKDI